MTTCEAETSKCSSPLKINIIGVCEGQKAAIIFNPDCKKWSCDHCQRVNADEWTHTATRGTMLLQEQGYNLRFVTITSRGYATPNSSLYFFQQNWPKLVRRASYHTNKDAGYQWSYLLIPERTKAGILHAHFIACTPLKTKWWKDNAHQVGFGYQAESKPLKDPKLAAFYASKYLGKDVIHTGWPKGFRRVRASRNWPKSRPKKLEGWEWSKHSDKSAWFEKHWLIDAGYEVKDKRQ